MGTPIVRFVGVHIGLTSSKSSLRLVSLLCSTSIRELIVPGGQIEDSFPLNGVVDLGLLEEGRGLRSLLIGRQI
jgi:hypothetical protein